jgi:hypothetical protein
MAKIVRQSNQSQTSCDTFRRWLRVFIKHFANDFFNATAICDPLGNANNITDEIWNSQAGAFHSLSDFAQATLINKTYTYGSTDGDSVGAAMERYDYIISKYGTSTFSDFIGRIDAGTR